MTKRINGIALRANGVPKEYQEISELMVRNKFFQVYAGAHIHTEGIFQTEQGLLFVEVCIMKHDVIHAEHCIAKAIRLKNEQDFLAAKAPIVRSAQKHQRDPLFLAMVN